jgi:hypothetical protein
VPTIEPVQALLDNGWGVYEASQQRSKSTDKDPYTKHMLRIRKLDDFQAPRRAVVGDGVAEVILINAHDGTARYHLKAGFFRFVCSNGMMVGSQLAGISIVHTQNKETTQEVLAAATRVVTESFPAMLENINTFQNIRLERSQAYRLAERALVLRYGDNVAPILADNLMDLRRPEDEDPTLWNWLNRIQENTVYGGFETRSTGYGRRSMVRPIERVSAVTRINAGLWDEADAIAKEAVAA